MSRKSGIMLHISSLPNDYGFGCFSKEAYEFVDFLHSSGFSYWQILPLNPTNESGSPFQSYSVFAGNPSFIDITEFLTEEELLSLKKGSITQDSAQNGIEIEQSLKPNNIDNNIQYFTINDNNDCSKEYFSNNDEIGNKNKQVAICNQLDFLSIYNTRIMLLKNIFDRDFNKYDLTEFKKENSFWLNDYATFMVLKDIYKTPYWKFPNGLGNYNQKDLDSFRNSHEKEIEFYIFVQYLFFKQWKKLKTYANTKGIQIFGDLAFYPAGDSCDVWANKKDFCFTTDGNPKGLAGVPPDYFSKDGQLWGSPVYNIEEMKKNNYRFFTKRFEHAYNFFDVVRLDHFRGFESFWVVGDYKAKNAKKGKWVKGLGLDFFKTLKNKKVPKLVAEDLGTITKGVKILIEKLDIAGMKVFQFAFDGNPKNAYFPHNYIDNCVAYIGTHDNNTFIGFLETEINDKTKSEIKKYLGQSDNATNEELLAMVLSVMLNSRAKMVILTMQDILFLDASFRMNTPSTVTGNWCFRLKDNYNTQSLKNFLLKLNISANRA